MRRQAIYVGLGANVGDCLANFRKALEKISNLPDTEVLEYSSVYETEPVGDIEQPNFLNMVVKVSSGLSPESFLRALRKIESELGRVRKEKWGPRVIDLDILYWDSLILDLPDLKIPHPEAQNRRFVLVPISEIAPDLTPPPGDKTISELLENVRDTSWIKLFLPRDQFNHNQ